MDLSSNLRKLLLAFFALSLPCRLVADDGTTGQLAFIPEHSTVLLVTGLPGDLDSANAYDEQLQSWLITLNNRRPGRVLVFTDEPDRVSHSGFEKATIATASKASLNAAARELESRKDPLILIAWGHGGRQGNTPVFHVRGPRITAADFAGFATKNPSVLTRYVLTFRGSGGMAQEIAGPGREILSSEAQTTFTSDPIAMPIFLKIAQAGAALPFEILGRRLAREIAGWYATRSLARTEEPTLWLGSTKPRSLIEPDSETAEAAGAGPGQEPAAENKDKAAQPNTATELTGAWATLKKVDAGDYPEQEGVVLSRKLNFVFAGSPAVSSESDEYIQVLSDEGKRLGDFDVAFTPPQEEIVFLNCEVLSREGKLIALDPDAIRDARENTPGEYPGASRKVFSLPHVEPGAVLHVRYKTIWKTFPLPYVSMPLPVVSELASLKSLIEVTVPSRAAFHYAVENLSIPDPQIAQGKYGTTYSWHLTNLPAATTEILSSPHEQPRLLVSTFPDWKAFAEWYGRISRLTAESTPEIRAKAAALTKGIDDEKAKAMAIYNFVTSMRYVAIPLGVNSLRPHSAANVLANQYGDCKDKANLFNALLRCVDIDSQLVLVPRFSQALDAVPGLAFNHAISKVGLKEETLWVDTTDEVCRFGMLPPGDPGRKVLLIDGSTATLTELPRPLPKDHKLMLRVEIDCVKPSALIPATIKASGVGFPDYQFRTAALHGKEAKSVPLLNSWLKPIGCTYSLETQLGTSPSALDENFTWTSEGAFIGLWSQANGRGLIRAPFWLPIEWEAALHHRKTGLFLNQGYPLTLEEQLEFSLPGPADACQLPNSTQNKEGPIRWEVSWAKSGPGRLLATLNVTLESGELDPAQTSRAQDQIRKLLAAISEPASASLER